MCDSYSPTAKMGIMGTAMRFQKIYEATGAGVSSRGGGGFRFIARLPQPMDDSQDHPPLCLPRAILFDMEGTLPEPMLDFPRIKADMGIGDRPILEALGEMGLSERAVAEATLLRHEQHAAENSALNPGCRELLEWLDPHRLSTALIPRHSRLKLEVV